MSTHGGGSRGRSPGGGGSAHLPAVDVMELARGGALRARLQALVGHPLTDAEIGSLVGARAGDHILLANDAHDGGVFITLSSDAGLYEASRSLYRAPDGALVMENGAISIEESARGQGLGTRIFAAQVAGLRQHGVDRIETTAAGYGPRSQTALRMNREPSRYNGYYTWPRLGYNAPIDPVALGLPSRFAGVRSLLQLMSTPDGRAAWRDYGSRVDVTFDLHTGSASLDRLNAYLQSRGMPEV